MSGYDIENEYFCYLGEGLKGLQDLQKLKLDLSFWALSEGIFP